MKKILALLLVFLMATAVMVACGDDTKPDNNASASVENHPDAVAMAEELNTIWANNIAGDKSNLNLMNLMSKACATPEGNKVIFVAEFTNEFLEKTAEELGTTVDELIADISSFFENANPFKDESVANQYPGVEAFECIVKLSNGEVIFTETFTK